MSVLAGPSGSIISVIADAAFICDCDKANCTAASWVALKIMKLAFIYIYNFYTVQ